MPCSEHPDYLGLTKRAKCPGCLAVYEAETPRREEVKALRTRVAAGKARLKSLGPSFKAGSADHWRAYLFSPSGLDLKPTAFTEKRKEPQVDDDAMEKLAKKHPKIDVLRDRVALSKATRRLSTELAVEPDGVGRVHFAYSLHRTNTGRLASGSDDVDADKIRVSPGNAQNKSDRDRMMYTAPPGYVFVQADYSQIESRVCAWHANDMALLDAWEKGADVYAEIAAKLYRVPVEETRNKYIWFMGDHRSLRDAGKRAHLALCYYMQPPRMADLFDIPLREAVRLSDQWKASRVAICRWQQAQIEAASSSFEGVINSFGRRFWFPKKRTDEGWVVADPAAAVAAKPQSDVGDMCKVVLPLVNAIEGGELVTTTHDSFALYVKDEPTLVARVAHELKGVLERAWPEFGFRNINGKPGRFRCPVEIAVGKNWAKHHEHNPKCEVPCKKVENPQGLKEYKCAH